MTAFSWTGDSLYGRRHWMFHSADAHLLRYLVGILCQSVESIIHVALFLTVFSCPNISLAFITTCSRPQQA